jgi:Arc/MetJ-type ribon-helix-helix transcriptional regulator
MAETQQKNFRLSPATLDLIERLSERFGGIARSDVIRIALQRLAETELGAEVQSGKKISRKSR